MVLNKAYNNCPLNTVVYNNTQLTPGGVYESFLSTVRIKHYFTAL